MSTWLSALPVGMYNGSKSAIFEKLNNKITRKKEKNFKTFIDHKEEFDKHQIVRDNYEKFANLEKSLKKTLRTIRATNKVDTDKIGVGERLGQISQAKNELAEKGIRVANFLLNLLEKTKETKKSKEIKATKKAK